jgi:hypothetical protein
MAGLTAPDSTSTTLTRLGASPSQTIAALGPLAGLLGTWIGSHGVELIAVPDFANRAEDEKSARDGFRLIIRPYVEVITFSPIGAPVPDRGGPAGDIFIRGLVYDIRISDLETDEPLHVENGMWLNLGENQSQPIVRQGSVPHGDVFLALGGATTAPGKPKIPSISGLPTSGPATPAGYTDAYTFPSSIPGYSAETPNSILQGVVTDQEIVTTTTLAVNTANGGGIVNIPFVSDNAATPSFAATYWIETVKDPKTGDEIQQLQYSQQADLLFIPQFGNPEQLIVWPHVTVNTLLKQ